MLLNLFYIFLIIIILIVIILITDNTPVIPDIVNPDAPKCCILLTAYIKNREDIYYQSVKRWLDETMLNIYLVDSSNTGLTINHPRFHQFKFKQNDNFAAQNPSKYEITSILKAYDYFKFKEDIVIKVTGKYFIPKLESKLNYVPSKSEIILQYRADTHGQNTELMGIKSNLIPTILNQYTETDSFESFMCYIKNHFNSWRFTSFKLDQYVKRGDGSTLYFL
jgi:hypothetical protein